MLLKINNNYTYYNHFIDDVFKRDSYLSFAMVWCMDISSSLTYMCTYMYIINTCTILTACCIIIIIATSPHPGIQVDTSL